MGINSAQDIMEKEGIDAKKIMADKMENAEFSMELENNNNDDDEAPLGKKDENNLNKEKEKPETKSFTADAGGEGTTDSVMNPINKPKESTDLKKITKKGDKWCVLSEDGSETLGCHNSRDEAIDQLQAIEANKSEVKAEDSLTEEKQEKLVMESPLEKVTNLFTKKIDARTKELEKKAAEE